MINYQSSLGLETVPSYSPYFSESLLHRHPLWPTHVLWAQLLTVVILHEIDIQRTAAETQSVTPHSDRTAVNTGVDASARYQEGFDTTYGLCIQVKRCN